MIGFSRTWQRPPTREELDGLIRDRVREEERLPRSGSNGFGPERPGYPAPTAAEAAIC